MQTDASGMGNNQGPKYSMNKRNLESRNTLRERHHGVTVKSKLDIICVIWWQKSQGGFMSLLCRGSHARYQGVNNPSLYGFSSLGIKRHYRHHPTPLDNPKLEGIQRRAIKMLEGL